jgi:hypothetical protein
LKEQIRRSGRRSFVRRLLKLGAAASVAGLALGELQAGAPLPLVEAATSGPILIDQANSGSGNTLLVSTPSSGAVFRVIATTGVGDVESSGIASGIRGETWYADGGGVNGHALASSGETTGVGGYTRSPSFLSTAVYGLASASGYSTREGFGIGAFGESHYDTGIGVVGVNSSISGHGYGVLGVSLNPYSLQVSPNVVPIVAQGVSGQIANLQEWQTVSGTAATVVNASGSLGVGTNSPSYPFDLQAPVSGGPALSVMNSSSSDNGAAIRGEASSPNGFGVFGYNNATSGFTTGVYGRMDASFLNGVFSDSAGVVGHSFATSGNTVGVFGRAESSDAGCGVQGAVEGNALQTGSPTGVVGVALSGRGVYGWSTYGTGVETYAGKIGVYARARFFNSSIPFVALGASGQTSNLQEWRSFSGAALSVLNASGSLGVGTASPSYAVDVQTSGSSSSQMHIAPTGTDTGGYLTSANAGNLFMSAGAAWNGSTWVAKSSSAYQYGGGTAGVRFFFDTGLTVGSTYTPTTRMFIGPTGHVGIGMSTAPAHLLQLGSDDAAKPSTNTWTIASDGRLKDPKSIEPFTEGSEFIKQLPQPVWFRYRKESGLPSDRRVAGWIAQDIAPIAPFMVRRTRQKLRQGDDEESETLSLNTNELPYALVNSVKEILEENRRKSQEIKNLRARVEKLERADKSN